MARRNVMVLGPVNYGDPIRNDARIIDDLSVLRNRPEKVDLVLFVGGEDIHPSFYKGRDINNLCMANLFRDQFEEKVFKWCQKSGIKVSGVCRGFQFINVMAGGRMYQHIEGHTLFDTHKICWSHGDAFQATSTHHQLVDIPEGAIATEWASPSLSDIYINYMGELVEGPEHEVEAAIFPNINGFGVQYHPELMDKSCAAVVHYRQLVLDFIDMNVQNFIQKYGGQKYGLGHLSREARQRNPRRTRDKERYKPSRFGLSINQRV